MARKWPGNGQFPTQLTGLHQNVTVLHAMDGHLIDLISGFKRAGPLFASDLPKRGKNAS